MRALGTRLELTWPGKEKFLLTPRDADGKPQWVERTHPAAHEVRLADFTGQFGEVNDADPYADNLLFTGDSLDVLRVLSRVPEYARQYRGRVKLAYWDPPFNSGGTFAHYDDWLDHSTWLSFMRDRLLLMKDLLAPDGSVWIHLDNYEVHRMRVLMDEVFGPANFLSTVIWQRTTAKSTAQRSMGTLYDTILVYAKSDATRLERVLMPYSDKYLSTKYSNEDERGRYRLDNLTGPGIRHGSSGQPWRGIDIAAKNLNWRAPNPNGVLDHLPPNATTQEKLDALLEAGYIQLPKKEGGMPQFKRYLNDDGGVAVGDLWTDITVLNSQSHERSGYSTQKPEAFVERILKMGTNPGDIVLDAFAGSGTTAAAAQKMRRRWVTVELSQENVESFTRPRLEKVVLGDDQGGVSGSVGWDGGGGFRTVSIAPTAYAETPFGVMLDGWATEGDKFARLMAGQLGFFYEPDGPFCGRRGRMRLVAIAGQVGIEEAAVALSALDASERVTIVATVLLDGVEEFVREQSRGSRVMKAPRDVLRPRRIRKGAES